MSAGVLRVPVRVLVAGSVVWKAKPAGSGVTGAGRHWVAVPGPTLMMVANAVAGLPTWTERPLGRTAATSRAPETGTSSKAPMSQVAVPLASPSTGRTKP